MTTLEVDTPHGLAKAHLHAADQPRAALVLGHGAAGGVALDAGVSHAVYLLVSAAEEGLEMAGSILLLYAAMCLLRLRPEPGGGYHLSTGDPELVHSQAAEHTRLAGHRRPSAPFSSR